MYALMTKVNRGISIDPVWTRQSDAKNRHTARNAKCRFCDDFFGSHNAVHAHEVQAHRELVDESDQYDLSSEETRLRFTNQRYEMPAPVVVYADFESAIDDKNKHKPIMLSCLAISRIPVIDSQLRDIPCTTRERRGSSSFHGISRAISRECENVSLR